MADDLDLALRPFGIRLVQPVPGGGDVRQAMTIKGGMFLGVFTRAELWVWYGLLSEARRNGDQRDDSPITVTWQEQYDEPGEEVDVELIDEFDLDDIAEGVLAAIEAGAKGKAAL